MKVSSESVNGVGHHFDIKFWVTLTAAELMNKVKVIMALGRELGSDTKSNGNLLIRKPAPQTKKNIDVSPQKIDKVAKQIVSSLVANVQTHFADTL